MSNLACYKCSRTFFNENGLKTNERKYNRTDAGTSCVNRYKDKRIANISSVQIHWQSKPKLKFEDLEADIKKAAHEAKKFEKFLLEKFSLEILGYKNSKDCKDVIDTN
jgi:hypothetical protein